jgi:tetratricopeptide (TPR) repeat protein/predicted Ser/Thr protein kinase
MAVREAEENLDDERDGDPVIERPPDDDPDTLRLKATVRSRLFGRKSEELRIGRFVVLKRLGEGGMGVVYAAYDAELDRKLAIKLIRADPAEAASEQATARLLREAKSLARVSHPNVVQIYDVGTHGDEVYVAMEFVEGETLADWMQRADPHPWRDVLAKYIQAGRGLAAAHHAKLVHRDFKPANVIVSDGGEVRVLDFGLARRVLRDGAVELTPAPRVGQSALNVTITHAGTKLGTPAYMAPEQHLGTEITARTDQFCFCVGLWEALYGERPFGGKNLTSLAVNVAQGKLRRPPKGTQVPDWLRKVVTRGLAVEPDDRFPSMDALLAELSRDPGARRRRLLIVAGIVAAVGGTLGASYVVRQQASQVCQRGQARLAGVWDDARRAKVRESLLATSAPIAAETWTRVETRLDEYVGGWVEQYTDACTANQAGEQSDEMLDLRMRCLDRRLDAVRAQVEVLTQADETVVEQATTAVAQLPALGLCGDTEALSAQIKPPDDPNLAAEVQRLREELAQSDALAESGKFSEALDIASNAMMDAEALDYLPIRAETRLRKGETELELELYGEAEKTLASAYWVGVEAEHDEVAAAAASGRMIALAQLERQAEALEWAQHAKAVVSRIGSGGEAEARFRASYGYVLSTQAKYEEAEEEFERALELYKSLFGENHPRVAAVVTRIGIVKIRKGDHPQARALFQEAVQILETGLGPGHPHTARPLRGIGGTYRREGKLAQARAAYERAIAVSEAAFGPDHISAARTLLSLGVLSRQEADYEVAEANYRRALKIYEASRGKEHRDVARALSNLGVLYEVQERYEEALGVQEQALAMRQKVVGNEHPDTADSFDNVGEIYGHLGRHDRALEHHQRALDIREKAIREKGMDPYHEKVARTAGLVGKALLALDKHDEAMIFLEKAVWTFERNTTAPRTALAASRFELAKLLWERPTDRQRSLGLARKARETYAAESKAGSALKRVDAWLADRSHPSE